MFGGFVFIILYGEVFLCVGEGIIEIISEIILEKLLKEDGLYFRIYIDAALLTIECFKLGIDDGLISLLTHQLSLFNIHF